MELITMSSAAEDAAIGRRRGVFEIDSARALEALRVAWGDAYAVCFDDAILPGGAGWRAWRLDSSGTMVTGTTPDELDAAIRADWQAGL
jgi:hypothetical protein